MRDACAFHTVVLICQTFQQICTCKTHYDRFVFACISGNLSDNSNLMTAEGEFLERLIAYTFFCVDLLNLKEVVDNKACQKACAGRKLKGFSFFIGGKI